MATVNYVFCKDCGKKIPTSAKRSVSNGFYRRPNGVKNSKTIEYYDLCKTCMKRKCYDDDDCSIFNKAKFMSLLKNVMNRPYLHETYEKTIEESTPDRIFDRYVKKISCPAHFNKTWLDGDTFFENNEIIDEDNTSDNNEVIDMQISSDFEVTPEMIRKWGMGYTKQDYEFLEYNYNEWSTKYKCDTFAEEKTFQFLCLKELEIRKARESNSGNVDRLEETFRKFMNDANVTPRDANSANDPDNMSCLGLWIKDIEKKRPAEHFKESNIYADFDNFGEYLERFVFRPLKNLLTGSRDFDKEFSVETIMEEEDGED